MPDRSASGIPPPGCALPPAKYKPPILRDRFGCRQNAAIGECDAIPYRLPYVEPVSRAMSAGVITYSSSINAPTSHPSARDSRVRTAARARAAAASQSCPASRGAFSSTNQFSPSAGASAGSTLLVMLR